VKLSATQKMWLRRLVNGPQKRLRYGAPGMPERTANALVKAGLAKIELQNLFRDPKRGTYKSHFVVPVEQPNAKGNPMAWQKTRFSELGYRKAGEGWRLVDTSTDNEIGPEYGTKLELFTDLQRQYETRFQPAVHWLDAIRSELEAVAGHYDKAAPTVCDWANGLYARLNDEPDSVRLVELLAVERFREAGQWENPNVAANRIYKLMHRLGQDTTGHAGY